VRRRKAEALLDLLDDVETLGEVFFGQGLVVLQPKGIPIEELPTTLRGAAEIAALHPRFGRD